MNFGYRVGHSDGPGPIAVAMIVAIALAVFFGIVAPAIR